MDVYSINTTLPYPTREHQELQSKDTNKPNPKLGSRGPGGKGEKGIRGKRKELG